jgi:hypothetical protein
MFDHVVGLLADDEQLALEFVRVGYLVTPTDEDLADERFKRSYAFTQTARVNGDIPPAEQDETFPDDVFGDGVLAYNPAETIGGQEDHPYPVPPRRGKVETKEVGFGTEEGIGDLNEHPRPIACQRVGSDRAAMGEVGENRLALLDDPVTLSSPDVRDEPDPTRVVV